MNKPNLLINVSTLAGAGFIIAFGVVTSDTRFILAGAGLPLLLFTLDYQLWRDGKL